MKRIILMGGIFSVILLLMMSVAPAVQLNAVENQLKEKYEELSFNIDILDGEVKFPSLFTFVKLVWGSRILIGFLFLFLGIRFTDDYYNYPLGIILKHPIIISLGVLQLVRGYYWQSFWVHISEELNWGWPDSNWGL